MSSIVADRHDSSDAAPSVSDCVLHRTVGMLLDVALICGWPSQNSRQLLRPPPSLRL